MDVINTDNKDQAAGDVPVSSSFEKQESFTSDMVVVETLHEGVTTTTAERTTVEESHVEVQEEPPAEMELTEMEPKGVQSGKVEETPKNVVETKIVETVTVTTTTVIEMQDDSQPSDGGVESEPPGPPAAETLKDVEMESEAQSEKSMEMVRADEKMEKDEEQQKEGEEKSATPPPAAEEEAEVKTPRTRGRKPNASAKTDEPPKTAPTTGKRGRKRKVPLEEVEVTPAKTPKTPRTPGRGVRHVKVKLSYTDYVSSEVGDRVLSCGEGEQLGHPGRTTTKKPRKVDIIEDDGLQIVQVVAGGVHSALLTADGEVYMCGINEQGTVPAIGVEPEGSTDKFTKVELSDEIRSQGKIVMLAAGASFTAALTDKGSVIVWGNLRDTSGEINVHPLLTNMKDHPVVLIHYRKRVIVKIAAGENHLVMLEEDGKVLTFGDGQMGQLGRTKRTGAIRPQYMVDEDGKSLILILQDKKRRDVVVKDIHAGGYWTILISDDQVYSFGLNNFDHLGVPVEGEAPTDPTAEDKRELRILTPGIATAYLGRRWTHIDGVQHIIARDAEGEVFGIGKNTDNALGLGTWTGNDDSEHWKYSTLERIKFPEEAGKIAGTTAKLGCSLAWTEDGHAYAWGCDTSGQLGLGLKDDDEKVVPTPQKISSAHLDGFKIMSASISDNHCLFLAKKL